MRSSDPDSESSQAPLAKTADQKSAVSFGLQQLAASTTRSVHLRGLWRTSPYEGGLQHEMQPGLRSAGGTGGRCGAPPRTRGGRGTGLPGTRQEHPSASVRPARRPAAARPSPEDSTRQRLSSEPLGSLARNHNSMGVNLHGHHRNQPEGGAGVMYTRPPAECGHYRKPMRSEIRQLTARRPSATPMAITARKTAWQALGEG